MAGRGGGDRGHGRYVVVGGPGWRGRLISHAPQLGRMGARSSPPVYAARSPAPLTRGRWAALRSEPGITSARTFRGSEDDIPSGMRGWGGDGTERRRSRWSEAEAAAHPAGGEGEATAQRVGDRGGSPSGRRREGSDGTESRRLRRQPIRQEERGKRRHRESETEAVAHPAGRRGGSEGTESRRQRRRCHTAEGDPGGSRGEGEAAQRTAAHPAGGARGERRHRESASGRREERSRGAGGQTVTGVRSETWATRCDSGAVTARGVDPGGK